MPKSNRTNYPTGEKHHLFKHGHAIAGKETSEYWSWRGMMARCYYKSHKNYKEYGGRGITVCERWHNFKNFLADMGKKPTPKHSIDRHPNRTGNYEPGNCRWATHTQQTRNTSRNKYITHEGKTLCQSEWIILKNLTKGALEYRLKKGWPIDRALNTPLSKVHVHKSG